MTHGSPRRSPRSRLQLGALTAGAVLFVAPLLAACSAGSARQMPAEQSRTTVPPTTAATSTPSPRDLPPEFDEEVAATLESVDAAVAQVESDLKQVDSDIAHGEE